MEEFKNDHDAIITLVSEVRYVQEGVKEVKEQLDQLKDGLADRVERMELKKMNTEDVMKLKVDADKIHADHEERIRMMEKWSWRVIGGLIVLQFLIPLILEKIFRK